MIYAHIILYSDRGRKPLSHRVEVQNIEDYKEHKAQYQERAVLSLCKSRGLIPRHLKEYGYNSIGVKFEIKEGI